MSDTRPEINVVDPEECEICTSKRRVTTEMVYHQDHPATRKAHKLCEVCRSSFASVVFIYPPSCSDGEWKIIKNQSLLTNMLLEEIDKLAAEITELRSRAEGKS